MSASGQVEQGPGRTAEQQAAVRRRALPVAAAGVVLGVLGVVLPLTGAVTAHVPPSLLAVNLAFCAMMMGAGILFYAKGAPGTRLAAGAAVLALVLGMAGTLLYTRQAVESRRARENQDTENVAAIARGAARYAQEHGGAYPKDLAALLAGKYVEPRMLLSPWGGQGTAYLLANKNDFSSMAVAEHSDYTYIGGDLHEPLGPVARSAVIVVYETYPVQRTYLTIGLANGTGLSLTQEQAVAWFKSCNDVRRTLNLPPVDVAGGE